MDLLRLILDNFVWPLLGYLGWAHMKNLDREKRITVLEVKFNSDKEQRDKQFDQVLSRFDKLEERMVSKLDTLETHLRGGAN